MICFFQFYHMCTVCNYFNFPVKHKKKVYPCQSGINMIRFQFHHPVQNIQSILQPVSCRISCYQIIHRFKIFLDIQCFGKTLNCIRQLSYPLSPNPVIFQNIKIFLVVFTFYFFRYLCLGRRE